jgi:hypothetical protein
MKPPVKSITYFRNKKKRSIQKIMSLIAFITIMVFSSTGCSDDKKLKDGGLRIGWAMEDITPDGPASLFGQYYERISTYVQSPLKVTACAIESAYEKGDKEQAIMVSADLLLIPRALQDSIKIRVKPQIPDFDIGKLFLNATHTHSAPNPGLDWKVDSKPESGYITFLSDKLSAVVVSAWKNRKPAGISRGLGYAVIGHNRRVQYANGTAEMYGATDRPDFIGIEGASDPGVDMLFCWDLKKKLTGIIINVSCPAQVTEAKYYVSADYWSEVRKNLLSKYSKDIYVLEQIGAAGDLSPRDLPRGYKAGEPNMWDIPGIVEIGRRLGQVVDAVYPEAINNIQTTPVFKHTVRNIDLPARTVTEEEYKKASEIVSEIRSREPKDSNSPNTAWNRFLKELHDNERINRYGPWDNKESDYGKLKINERVLNIHANQEKHSLYNMELHVIRIGDVAIASNPFELYVDYGFRIKGRSKADQTFVVQLSCDYGDYLPTLKALPGGQYSALVSVVGPAGGQMLVDTTVSLINRMWE